MKELLASLAKFAENPEAVGDNLFTFFGQITRMNWEDVVAAGCAINVLAQDAYRIADEKLKGSQGEFEAFNDATYSRLNSCLQPVIVRIGELIAQAPKEQQEMLFFSVTTMPSGFIRSRTREAWANALGIELKKK